MKKKLFLVIFFSFYFFSCASPVFVRHPVTVGDYYYFYSTFYTVASSSSKTANGEVFSDKNYTCATKDFPFGTLLEITNLNNDKSVVVKVNDIAGSNVIDLSKIAFQKIANLKEGKIPVRVLVVDVKAGDLKVKADNKKISSKNHLFTIDINSFKDFKQAKLFNEKYLKYHSYIFVNPNDLKMYHLRVGKFKSKKDAIIFKKKHFSNKGSIVKISN